MSSDFLIILHCADLHIGRNRKYGDYLDQQSFMLEGILRQTAEACQTHPDCDVWLMVVGDVFDRFQHTNLMEFFLFMRNFMNPIKLLLRKHKNLKVKIIDGNHDRLPFPTEPSVLSPLVSIADEMDFAVVGPRYLEADKLLMLPYGGYSGPQMRALIDEYRPTFVMAHECLAEMTTDTGWKPPRDQDHYIKVAEVTEDTGVAGIFLGDIHKCQALDKKEICWYSGSPVTLDHGHKLPKGILHHIFKKVDGGYVQVMKPKLVPIDDIRIKNHYQLGVLKTREAIPWQRLFQHMDCYLSLTVTPEVYAEINQKIGGFFGNNQVDWSFKDPEVTASQEDVEAQAAEDLDTYSYYKTAIRDWSELNLKNLTTTTRDEFVDRVEKLFEARG